MPQITRAAFLDRDGVINVETNYVHKIEDFIFLPGVFDACRELQTLNYRLIVITNQAGIARGYYTEADFYRLNAWMIAQFAREEITIAKTYFCPHHPTKGIGPYRIDCACRKPKPGLILQAQRGFNLDLPHALLIGDKESDIEAGRNAGITHTFLVKTGHPIDPDRTRATYVVNSLADAAQIARSL